MRTTPEWPDCGGDNFQSAVMSFNDFPAHGQTKAQADITRGEKGGGNAFCGLGSETGAIVLHFNLEILTATAARPGLQMDIHPGSLRVRLKRVEHDFGQRVLERGAVASEAECFALAGAMQLHTVGGLVFARLLIGVFDQLSNRKRFLLEMAFAREKPHLVDQPRDPFDAVGERMVERFTEFGVRVFFCEQLLMRGERHHRVANLMRHAIGHGLDQTQILGLDFQFLQLLGLCEVLGSEQRGDQVALPRWNGTTLTL